MSDNGSNAIARGFQMPDAALPRSAAAPPGSLSRDLNLVGLPPSMAILLDDGLYRRVQQLAVMMSKATGMTPKHLIGQGEACFQVITNSLDWKLSYSFVAQHTYQTPGGSIGYDGTLVLAIMQKSGDFIGMPTVEYIGDWNQVTGKFKMVTGQRGGEYPVRSWTDQDAVGLGAIMRWRLKGEEAPRAWPGEGTPFWLNQVFPLNSPLWATDPRTQIRYLMIRRFAQQTSPGVLGAAAFDDSELLDAADRARDITPADEPRRPAQGFAAAPVVTTEVEEDLPYAVVDNEGVVTDYADLAGAIQAFDGLLQGAAGAQALDARWVDNQALLDKMRDELGDAEADRLAQYYGELRAAALEKEAAAAAAEKAKAEAAGKEAAETAPKNAPGARRTRQRTAAANEPPATAEAPTASPGADTAASQAPSPPVEGTPAEANQERQEAPPESPGAPQPAESGANEPAAASEQVERLPLVIACPTDRMGRKDLRTWGMALFLPRMRRTKTTEALHLLIEDNHENFELCQAVGTLDATDLASFKAEVEAQWRALQTLQDG